MPIGTAAAIIGGARALQSGIGIASASKQRKRTLNDLNNLKVPSLDNAFKDIQISTLGSDLLRQEGQRTSANLIDAVRSGGVRSVMSGIPQIVDANNAINNQAALLLDNQATKRDYAIAQDNARIRNINESRYQGELQGLGNRLNVANQNIWNGLNGLFTSASALANGFTGPRPVATSLPSIPNAGIDTSFGIPGSSSLGLDLRPLTGF